MDILKSEKQYVWYGSHFVKNNYRNTGTILNDRITDSFLLYRVLECAKFLKKCVTFIIIFSKLTNC